MVQKHRTSNSSSYIKYCLLNIVVYVFMNKMHIFMLLLIYINQQCFNIVQFSSKNCQKTKMRIKKNIFYTVVDNQNLS